MIRSCLNVYTSRRFVFNRFTINLNSNKTFCKHTQMAIHMLMLQYVMAFWNMYFLGIKSIRKVMG